MAKKNKSAKSASSTPAPDIETKAFSFLTPDLGEAGWSSITNGWGTFLGSNFASTPVHVLQSSAVYACVKRLSTDVAKLPLRLMRKLSQGGWEEANDHPVSRLLARPNRRMTTFEFISQIVLAHQLHGNAYVAIVRDPESAKPLELIPLMPADVSVNEAANGDLFYHVTHRMLSPNSQRLRAEDMIHVRNLSFDGIKGVSPISVASQVIQLTLAAQGLASKTFENGAHIGGVLTTPNVMSKEAIEQTTSNWRTSQSGVANAGKTPVLHGGLTYTRTAASPEETQLLESRKFVVEEVCRLFGVPPFKVFVVDRATTGNNVEEQNQSYIDDTLMAITRPIEDAFALDLLFNDEFGKFKFSFDFDELLRGNRADRVAAQAQALQNGLRSVNELRAEDNLPPVPGGGQYFIQLNMTTLDKVGQQPVAPDAQPSKPKEDAESESDE
ncbi:phage portal protein [Siccirubricoccus sp. KC 17139]|uniref:Phage portal protein n=1 Tax=Siccirubricoccus soli TaxID=2899147 RepID=A0ABT1CYR3_9PROT|nr:phage portal protein [Siccirubricoccus soli]MCO6414806.1 phage portal protein [Siccirubricoccus soli]MCP2680936.1 phage portal protein [Siccirubricoccus soli]